MSAANLHARVIARRFQVSSGYTHWMNEGESRAIRAILGGTAKAADMRVLEQMLRGHPGFNTPVTAEELRAERGRKALTALAKAGA